MTGHKREDPGAAGPFRRKHGEGLTVSAIN